MQRVVFLLGICFMMAGCLSSLQSGAEEGRPLVVRDGLICNLASEHSVSIEGDPRPRLPYEVHRVLWLSLLSCSIGNGKPGDELFVSHGGVSVGIASFSDSLVGVSAALFNSAVDAYGVMAGLWVGAHEMSGVMIGGITGFPLTGRPTITGVHGIQIGLLNAAVAAWLQGGIVNTMAGFSYSVQVGVLNAARIGGAGTSFLGGEGLQIGLLNILVKGSKKSRPWGQQWQFGLLNRTTSGWWLPLTNFGF